MSNDSEHRRDERIIVHVDADLAALLPGFIKAWKEEVRTMQSALEENDYETIRKMGHDMKGIGGSCGLDVISDLGKSLTEGAKAMDPQLIRKNLTTLTGYLERVELVYE